MTEEQAALASSLAEWATDRGFAEQVRAAEGKPSSELLARWSDLTDLGVLGIGVPESAGGAGGSLVDLACALEAAAAGMVPGPLLSTAVAAALLAEQADSAAGKRFLPGICDGSVRVGLAPSASDLRSDDGSVSGHVLVVADAGTATHLLVGSRAGSGNETWHLIPAEAAGVSIDEAVQGPDLTRTVGSVRLDGVPVESDARVEVPDAEHGGGARPRPRAVRPQDRVVPGDQAPLRRDARACGVGNRCRLGRGLGPRRGR
jgi:alkylation response protein AidB-like acyl-CoA dehydrogenase